MKLRAALSLLLLPGLFFACTTTTDTGSTGGDSTTDTGSTGGGSQGCAHGTSGPDCVPMDCRGPTPPDPDPQTCTTATDCKQPEGVCYLQDYCDDGPGYLFASYASPTCEAGSCKWTATASAPADTCPSAIPVEGTPCDASVNCTTSGPEDCTYTATLSCGEVNARASCEGGLWKIRSACDCFGADEASCGANADCEWRTPDCYDIAAAYCAPVAIACGAPGCPHCGPLTNKTCAEAASTCSRCGGGTDPMACVP